jgi:hypothetical protein
MVARHYEDRDDGERRADGMAIRDSDVTVLWIASDGLCCTIASYDDTRYQLRLTRHGGTVRTNLFSDYASALATSRDWRAQVHTL